MTESGLLNFIFLFLAAAAGWGLAWFSFRSKYQKHRNLKDIYHDYFIGLNYLLGDEPDEAIDTFIKALEVSSDTIETHLALGTLLRRRGKVDKAIKVHQELLARSGLPEHFADLVRLELSNNYIAAGLLDRAERLLKELLKDSKTAKPDALLQLTTIYQMEKEWDNAISTIQVLVEDSRFKKDRSIRSIGAHFCCELAEKALNDGHPQVARDHVNHAIRFDRNSARASLLLAKLEQVTKNYSRAIKELARLGNQHPHFISEIIEPMSECYEALGQGGHDREFEKYLSATLDENFRISSLLKLVELVRNREGSEAANILLSSKLRNNPSLIGMTAMLQNHNESTGGQLQSDLNQSVHTLSTLSQTKPSYQCNNCGFETKSLYWQCSSCQKWDTVKPILGIEGE